jgi:hypothetical protein
MPGRGLWYSGVGIDAGSLEYVRSGCQVPDGTWPCLGAGQRGHCPVALFILDGIWVWRLIDIRGRGFRGSTGLIHFCLMYFPWCVD